MNKLRLFKAEDVFSIRYAGVMRQVWYGPAPFAWDKREGLQAWEGAWLISHPMADHAATYRVVDVESFALESLPKGSPVGLVIEKINGDEGAEG